MSDFFFREFTLNFKIRIKHIYNLDGAAGLRLEFYHVEIEYILT